MANATTNPNNPPQADEAVLASPGNTFSFAWYNWFATRVARILKSPVASAVPASAADSGTMGQIACDANYLYVCIGANQWKRTPLSAW